MSEEALEEALESFLSGAAMGGIGNISKLFVDEAKNSDYNDLTNQSDAQTPEIPDNLDPKTQRALQDYQRHQQQRDTIRELLQQEQSYESRSELQKRLTREESTLQALEKDPVLQQVLQSTITLETDQAQVDKPFFEEIVKRNSWEKVKQNADGTYSLEILEFKSSETAPLTKNQKEAFAQIGKNGGVVVGKGKGIFQGNTVIQPGTVVKIIRGTQEEKWYVSSSNSGLSSCFV